MSKAPLVHLEGKLGKFGHARTFKVDGLGHLTKSKGRFVLHAAITASQAARLDEASKKVSAEEEARTRGFAEEGGLVCPGGRHCSRIEEATVGRNSCQCLFRDDARPARFHDA